MSRPGDKLSGALIRGEVPPPTLPKPGVIVSPDEDFCEPIPVDYVELVMAAACA